jgi:hypothetical protein
MLGFSCDNYAMVVEVEKDSPSVDLLNIQRKGKVGAGECHHNSFFYL